MAMPLRGTLDSCSSGGTLPARERGKVEMQLAQALRVAGVELATRVFRAIVVQQQVLTVAGA